MLVPFRFDALRVSVTLVDATGWHAIYSVASIVEFELEYGREQGRYAYNQRHLALAARKKRAVVAEFAGLTDLFVPVVEGNTVRQVLVAGPLRRTAPTRAEVLAGFLAVTGRDGHAGDRELLRYVDTGSTPRSSNATTSRRSSACSPASLSSLPRAGTPTRSQRELVHSRRLSTRRPTGIACGLSRARCSIR